MKTIDNSALSQADAQMESVHVMVAALDVDYDRLEDLREEFSRFEGEDLKAARLGKAEWPSDVTTSVSDDIIYAYDVGREVAELECLAGDNESLEQAEQTIHEDALCVEVRSEWQSLGDDFEPTQYRIVLCTGGPHVQIHGELDEHREPCRAWLEYADWGTGMTERVNQAGDEEALLSYSRCFYFGA